MTANTKDLTLERGRAALLVVDIQERLGAAMPPEVQVQVERNTCVLLEAARRLDLPVVVTQQYPKGLGQTVASVASAVAALEAEDRPVYRFDKLEFSACASAAWGEIWDRVARDQWIVTGTETHVCVYQTARDLCARGAAVHVARDAVVSRSEHNWRTGLDLIGRAGGVVSSTEVAVFDLLGRAGSDEFKALSRLIR